MIAVELSGRMGNQLFQYAFILNAASLINTKFALHYFHYPEQISNYFEMPSYDKKKNTVINKVIIWLSKINVRPKCVNELKKIEQINDWTLYKGYFQSFQFFKENANQIQKEFSIKENFIKEYEENINHIVTSKKILAIHYRGGDYNEEHFKLPDQYYYSCLEKINLEQYSVIVVTDDKKKARQAFKAYKEFIIQSNEPIIDFQIIKNAEIAIISNSSFAWWAAYLKKKKIFAPKHWLGFNSKEEYPQNIMLGLDWIWVDNHE